MKFEIETAALLAGLKTVSPAIASGFSLPILGNVKIEAANDEITLSTTNLDIYIQHKIPAKVKQDGETTLAFDLLSRLMARIQTSKTKLVLDSPELHFTAGDVKAELETLKADEFPSPLTQKTGTPVECEAENIIKPFSMLDHAICEDASRYVLQGVHISPTKDGTNFVASSGYLIAVYRGITISQESAIIPQSFVRALLKIAPKGMVAITISDGAINLQADTTRLQGKLIDGQFPNWQPAMPERTDQALSCGRKQLIEALRTCQIFSDRHIPAIYLTGKGKEIEVSNPGKVTAMVLGTELAGQPEVKIRLNSAFLVETLSVLESENVRIQVSGDNKPVMIEDGAFTAVINRLIQK